MVLVSGLAVAGSMLLLGATLNAIRPIYLDALPESSSAAAAGAIYDQLVSFIRLASAGSAGRRPDGRAWWPGSAPIGEQAQPPAAGWSGASRTASRHRPRRV